MTINCYKRGIYSSYVHVNYIINQIHHVKSVRKVCKESLLYIKSLSRLLRSLPLLWFFLFKKTGGVDCKTYTRFIPKQEEL